MRSAPAAANQASNSQQKMAADSGSQQKRATASHTLRETQLLKNRAGGI
jgi:hypothetical protein